MTGGTQVSQATCQPIPHTCYILRCFILHLKTSDRRHSGLPCHLPTTNHFKQEFLHLKTSDRRHSGLPCHLPTTNHFKQELLHLKTTDRRHSGLPCHLPTDTNTLFPFYNGSFYILRTSDRRHSGLPCHLPTTNLLTCCFTMDNFNEADGSKGQHTSIVNFQKLKILDGSKFPAHAKMQAAIFVIH